MAQQSPDMVLSAERVMTPTGHSVTIRPFDHSSDRDYAQLVALDKAVFPNNYRLEAEWREADRLLPEHVDFRRWVTEADGHFAGMITFFAPWWSPEPGKYKFALRTHPDWYGRGLYALQYEWMLATGSADVSPTTLITSELETFTEYRDMLRAAGYAIVRRYPRSELDLTAFDPSPYDGLVERVSRDLRLVQLSVLQAEHDDWLARMEDVSWEIQQDIPRDGELVRAPLEEFAKIFEYESSLPEAWFIAVDEATGQYVGMSSLLLSLTDPSKIYTNITGVRRAYRRMGVATALKIVAIRWAQARGCVVTETDNEENNPMYQINLKLGFRPIPAILDYKLDVTEGA